MTAKCECKAWICWNGLAGKPLDWQRSVCVPWPESGSALRCKFSLNGCLLAAATEVKRRLACKCKYT